ncbi:trehalose 6-phosphate synthase [Streptomyces sp. V4I2]|nr:trehalose 6-phosphate synthase [Streptomyces sp. V4I2]
MASTQAARSAEVLVASNRGPVSYEVRPDGTGGTLHAKRGGGGLVSGLSAIGSDAGTLWVCSALGDGDREAVRRGVGEPGVRMLDIPADVHADAYNGIANSVLWFVHHMLYQTPLEPVFDAEFRRQWASYETYNRAFAQALAEDAAEGAAVVVQDYHLALVPGMLRELRPDLRIGHFSHTPWAPPEYFRMLPDDIAGQLLRGMLGADRLGFLTHRWADAFTACCTEFVGGLGDTQIGVHGLGADADFLRKRAHEADVEERIGSLRAEIGEAPDGTARRAIVRVDRTELSKNIVRGLLAYRQLLDDQPEWRERVVHVAFAYPSRQDLAVYREYMAEVQRLADEINAAYGTPGWTPVLLHLKDDFARSLARVPSRRRGPRQPDPGRHEPRREGGAGGLRRGVRVGAVAGGGGVRGTGRGRDRRQPVRRGRDGGRAARGARHAGGRTGRAHEAAHRGGDGPAAGAVVPGAAGCAEGLIPES